MPVSQNGNGNIFAIDVFPFPFLPRCLPYHPDQVLRNTKPTPQTLKCQRTCQRTLKNLPEYLQPLFYSKILFYPLTFFADIVRNNPEKSRFFGLPMPLFLSTNRLRSCKNQNGSSSSKNTCSNTTSVDISSLICEAILYIKPKPNTSQYTYKNHNCEFLYNFMQTVIFQAVLPQKKHRFSQKSVAGLTFI